jgi:hypothetical protein
MHKEITLTRIIINITKSIVFNLYLEESSEYCELG